MDGKGLITLLKLSSLILQSVHVAEYLNPTEVD